MLKRLFGLNHSFKVLFAASLFAISCSLLAQEPQESGIAGSGEASSGQYKIGAGDTLTIHVYQEEDISATLPVRPDGRISTPLVEDMLAVGKTPNQLARDIEQELKRLYRNPNVTVLLESSVGNFSTQVRVLGEVQDPGSFIFREGMTLFDALTEAGGLTEFAAGRRGRLTRTIDDETEQFRVRIDRLMERGDFDENMPLQPGDVILVPQSVF